ncbi:hypothetical protein [Lentzea xinjiangensis]|nr:hypothetical protein [Lentzea xinjiangensis]
MIKKTLLATAVAGGAVLAAASDEDRSGTGVADGLCAAPWHWNGPLALLHEGHAPGYTSCGDAPAGLRDADISVADDACPPPQRWNGPLEIFTVDHSPSPAGCGGDPAR